MFTNFTHCCFRSLFSDKRQNSCHLWAKLNFKTRFCPPFISVLLLFWITASRIWFQGRQNILFCFCLKKLQITTTTAFKALFICQIYIYFFYARNVFLLWLARSPIYWEDGRTSPSSLSRISHFFTLFPTFSLRPCETGISFRPYRNTYGNWRL